MRKLQICAFVLSLFCFAAICQAESFTQKDIDGAWAFDRENRADMIMPEDNIKRMQEMPGKYLFKFDTDNKTVEMSYDGKTVQSGVMTFVSSEGNNFVYKFDNDQIELELKDRNTLLFKSAGTVMPFKREE